MHSSRRLSKSRFSSGGISIQRGPPRRLAWICATRLFRMRSPLSPSTLYRGRRQSGCAHRYAAPYRLRIVEAVTGGDSSEGMHQLWRWRVPTAPLPPSREAQNANRRLLGQVRVIEADRHTARTRSTALRLGEGLAFIVVSAVVPQRRVCT